MKSIGKAFSVMTHFESFMRLGFGGMDRNKNTSTWARISLPVLHPSFSWLSYTTQRCCYVEVLQYIFTADRESVTELEPPPSLYLPPIYIHSLFLSFSLFLSVCMLANVLMLGELVERYQGQRGRGGKMSFWTAASADAAILSLFFLFLFSCPPQTFPCIAQLSSRHVKKERKKEKKNSSRFEACAF